MVIPSIPPRQETLQRALTSVWIQNRPADAVAVTLDNRREGAPINRDRGLAQVQTDLVAFLDDDDEFGPAHLALLVEHLEATGADLVYPWFTVIGGTDPFPMFEGQPWDDDAPHQVPVTFLARTEAVRAAGGFSYGWDGENDPGVDGLGNRAGEDYALILRMVEARHKIVHLPVRTWLWFHHGANTSGLPTRW